MMQPFGAPGQKQQLIERLMQQYQESANRAQGLQRAMAVPSPFSPQNTLSRGISPSPQAAMPIPVTTPRQVFLPQAHPFIPARVGGV